MGKLTPEEVAEFVTSQPPRDIPDKIRRRLRPRNKVLLIVGTMFFVMGTAFSWIFLPRQPLNQRALDQDPGETTGEVLEVRDTMYSEGGSRHSHGTPLFEHEFEYTVDGQQYTSTCYLLGKKLKAGQSVRIEFLPDDPSIARIRGGRLDPYGLSTCFVLLFPVIGAGLLLSPAIARRRKLRLLREGAFTFAKVTDVKRTSVAVNNEYRYLVTTQFDVDGAPHTVKTTAYGDDVELAEKRHAEDENIGLLYDPNKPHRMLFTGRFLDDEWL